MNILIKRYRYTRWGVDGECYINGQKVCDTVEHPTLHRPCGEYEIHADTLHQFFLRANGPMKNIHAEISLGTYAMIALLHQVGPTHEKLTQRIKKALKRDTQVNLTIQNI